MGRVIPLASAYGVQMDNLTAAYAELTKGGIATNEATTYLRGMLNELGSESSDVATILREQTGQSFTQLMESGMSLGDVLQILGDSVNGDATAFANLWSSQEAGVGALALYNAGAEQFNGTLGEMQSSAGATATAFQTMESTTADALGDMQNAFDNLGIAIGDALTPLAEFGAMLIGNIVEGVTRFVTACPNLTAGILAAATAFGVAAVAVKALGDAVNISFPLLGLISIAIGGVVALVSALTGALDEETQKYNEATPAAREYADSLYEAEDALAEMEAAGYNAADATDAQRQAYEDQVAAVEVARSEYELMYQSMEEYVDHVNEVISASQELRQSLNDGINSVGQNATTAQAYVDRLVRLASQSSHTATNTRLMEGALSSLRDLYPEISASVEDFTTNAEGAAAAIEAQIEAARQSAELEAYNEKIQGLVEDEMRLQEEIDIAATNLAAAQRAARDANWFTMGQANDDLEQAQALYDGLVGELKNVQSELNNTEQAARDNAQAFEDAGVAAFQSMESTDQGLLVGASLVQEYGDDILSLCQAYDEVYDSALTSMQGQFDLFDSAKDATQELANSTAGALQEALDSQLEYWDQVQQNTEKVASMTAESIGVTQQAFDAAMPIIAQSDEAMAALANAAPGEAAQIINTYAEIQAKQQEVADSKADFITGFTEGLEALSQEMQGQTDQILADFDELTAQGHVKATEFIQSTIEGIASAGPGMKTEAYTHANAASQAIIQEFSTAATQVATKCNEIKASMDAIPSSKTITFNLVTNGSAPSITGNARGTRFSMDDVYIAGEEGPELIVGGYGSRVYTNDETTAILDKLARMGASADPFSQLQNGYMMDPMGNQGGGKNTYKVLEMVAPQYDPEWDVPISPAVEDIVSNALETSRRIMTPSGQWIDDRSSFDSEPRLEKPKEVVQPAYAAPTSGNGGTQEIKITVNGEGAIKVNSGIDKTQLTASIMRQVQNKLPGIIMNMLQEETFQEGDRTYAL